MTGANRTTRRWFGGLAGALAIAAGVLAVGSAAAQGTPLEQGRQRGWLDSSLFARVPAPGQSEGIAVANDGTVYVGTNQGGMGPYAGDPSKVFAYDRRGRLAREYTIAGQHLGHHGVVGMAFDGDGILYVLDKDPARVLALDPRTGAQRTYATFRDVPLCSAPGAGRECSQAATDFAPYPDYPVFAPDGTMYVTDVQQHLIWRIPPGGGEARVWFTDPSLDTFFAANGIQFAADGRTLVFAQTLTGPSNRMDLSTHGRVLTVAVRPDGRPGPLRTLWESKPGDGPDGIAIGRSGRIYVALAAGNAVVAISPQGRELVRVTSNPRLDVPFDAPASMAFRGNSLMVTNQSFLTGTPEHWAVFELAAGEPGLPLHRPKIRVRR